MPLTIEPGRAYGDGIYIQKRSDVSAATQLEHLARIIEWLGGVAPVPGPDPNVTVDVDLDNDGVDDVRVTIDDIPPEGE